MRDVLALIAICLLGYALWIVSLDALDAEARASEARAAALAAQQVAEEAQIWAFEATLRRDTVCDCTYNLKEDPLAKHLRHAAAIECKRCQIVTTMAKDLPPPHDGEP